MTSMETLVQNLLATNGIPTEALQRINEALLKEYKLSYGGFLTILPKEVEAYYMNRHHKPMYIDANIHCWLAPRTNDEIRPMQSNRFGRPYMHRKGLGGMDVCLSDSDDYALSFTIKAAVVNGEECWSPLRVRNAVLDAICKNEGLECNLGNKQLIMARMNRKDAPSMLSLREERLAGDVYHQRRKGLRRRDKYAVLPLRSFMDLWNKKLTMGNVQKINLYMSTHPEEDVLEVLRRQGFRYIPTEIKTRYNIDKRTKLYE